MKSLFGILAGLFCAANALRFKYNGNTQEAIYYAVWAVFVAVVFSA